MVLLAFDTATSAVTVAVHDGSAVAASRRTTDGLRHGELLAPAIAAVMAEADVEPGDLTKIGVGVGPGPFTGLRIGLVTARMLGATLGIPVDGVCTLDVLAAETTVAEDFVVATDARRREVFWASYVRDDPAGPPRRVTGPEVAKPAELATYGPVVGRGGALYPDFFPRAELPEHPSAAVLAQCVVDGSVPLLDPEPLYLRRPDVSMPSARKSVLPR